MRVVTKSLAPSDNRLFSVELCGTSYCDETYKIKRENTETHKFAYVISGKGKITTPKGKEVCETCDVFYLPAGEKQECRTEGSDAWTHIWFSVKGELVDSLMRLYGVDEKRVFKNCRVFSLFDEFVRNINGMIDRNEAESECAILLHKIISAMAVCEEEKVYGKPDDATVMKEYIDTNYTKVVSNKELADLIYKSESQTIRIFKKAFGKTPYDYSLERKLLAAKQMLKSTGMPVRDIASALGFTNEHYFSSCFKKHEGITPLKYRKS
ncbi:MAG: helix-turn-helix transcriptional regulator [Clostridia bacterium]|nr:helix-turn-helix transcriptional regulator [Clostridia bacterium]